MSNIKPYRMGWSTRHVARAIVNHVKPRWDDYVPEIDDEVLRRFERDLGRFPIHARMMVVFAMWLVQWAGPLVFDWPLPFTLSSWRARERRLRRFHTHPISFLRHIFRAIQTMMLLICYDIPEVQAHIGVDRQAWRENRRVFRQKLLDADAKRATLPPPPAALEAHGVVAPEHYLHGPASPEIPTRPPPEENPIVDPKIQEVV